MAQVDIEFCFYDDPAYLTDADRDSSILREWHKHLWSRELPNGDEMVVLDEPGTGGLTLVTPSGHIRASSDTIATTHSGYARFGIPELWASLSPADQERYDRGFYTIGGFTIFPTHTGSLNQRRGTSAAIADRFDLTLECIRQHYMGKRDNPLADVLAVDADFFRLFGEGLAGFLAYVEFFHLNDLVADGSIRWFDDSDASEWDFNTPPLPGSAETYHRYLGNVLAFVSARNIRIRKWCGRTAGNS